MKRLLVLLTVILLCCAAPVALANSWGLLGGLLLDCVSETKDWNDYHSISGQMGEAAVMHSRYHNTLLMIWDGDLQAYTTAVYQPGHEKADKVSLNNRDGYLIISYGDDEKYIFHADIRYSSNYDYVLEEAWVNGLHFCLDQDSGWSYSVQDGDQTLVLQGREILETFNINLFPRTLDEVVHLNLVRDAGIYAFPSQEGVKLSGVGEETAPVYSAPFGKSAWRAAKGKAAVDLSDDLWVMRYYTNADGQEYALIRYDVSRRTQRFGYVEMERVGKVQGVWSGDTFPTQMRVQARQDTYLTDDPLVSQYPQFQVPEGTWFDCMGMYGDYAYVSAEVDGDEFVAGGQIVWGFVPLKHLDVNPDVRGNIRYDVMEQMAGKYSFWAGGATVGCDSVILHADGTYTGNQEDWEYTGNQADRDFRVKDDSIRGKWYVTDYHDSWGLYWNDPPYEITLIQDDGRVIIQGLTLHEEGFSVTFYEGGGGYYRVPESEIEDGIWTGDGPY